MWTKQEAIKHRRLKINSNVFITQQTFMKKKKMERIEIIQGYLVYILESPGKQHGRSSRATKNGNQDNTGGEIISKTR